MSDFYVFHHKISVEFPARILPFRNDHTSLSPGIGVGHQRSAGVIVFIGGMLSLLMDMITRNSQPITAL